MELYCLLAAIGLVGGFLAGWVGLGGGIILAPLLLYVPPLVGLEPFDMKEVARLTIIQSLCSTAAAGLAHRRARTVHGKLVVWMGMIIAMASAIGAFVSEFRLVPPELLLGLLAAMAMVASVLMFRRPPEGQTDMQEDLIGTVPSDTIPSDTVPADIAPADTVPADIALTDASFSRQRSALVALGVGFLGGMVGQSGGFLTIPLLMHVCRMPTRLAIGSSLGITFGAALAGSIGKFLGGGPIVWMQVAALVAGSLAGSQFGTALSFRVSSTFLRYVLAVLIGSSAVRMWYQVFH